MEERYQERLISILNSEHKNELIIGLMKDLRMYINQETFIKSVIKSKEMSAEDKISVVSEFLEE